jgi:hypothetical protein
MLQAVLLLAIFLCGTAADSSWCRPLVVVNADAGTADLWQYTTCGGFRRRARIDLPGLPRTAFDADADMPGSVSRKPRPLIFRFLVSVSGSEPRLALGYLTFDNGPRFFVLVYDLSRGQQLARVAVPANAGSPLRLMWRVPCLFVPCRSECSGDVVDKLLRWNPTSGALDVAGPDRASELARLDLARWRMLPWDGFDMFDGSRIQPEIPPESTGIFGPNYFSGSWGCVSADRRFAALRVASDRGTVFAIGTRRGDGSRRRPAPRRPTFHFLRVSSGDVVQSVDFRGRWLAVALSRGGRRLVEFVDPATARVLKIVPGDAVAEQE